MSEFKWNCPHCEQHLKCDESLSGKQIVCPACKHLITIPAAPGQATAGNYTPESGRTWDTFVPPREAGGLKIAKPSGETAQPDKPGTSA